MSINNEDREFLSALGERIARLRKEHGITQTQLAQLLGVSQQAVQAYEAGSRSIQVTTLARMAKALFASVEELFGHSSEAGSRKRGPAPKWHQRLEAIDQLPNSQQKVIVQMLDALIAQATTKASNEERGF
jgi:transcriptional regulator with XRE-family HTH domain